MTIMIDLRVIHSGLFRTKGQIRSDLAALKEADQCRLRFSFFKNEFSGWSALKLCATAYRLLGRLIGVVAAIDR
jgi:hypothetical protein